MSELMYSSAGHRSFRGHLLVTVSTFALAMVSAAPQSKADDRPTVWIELGGQFEQMENAQEPLTAPFLTPLRPDFAAAGVLTNQKPVRIGYGAEGKVTFAPEGTDWAFSAAIRYGRSNRQLHGHHETQLPTTIKVYRGTVLVTSRHGGNLPPNLADVAAKSSASQSIVDFQAGKDVGLGMFTSRDKSALSFGVRFAQFNSHASADILAAGKYWNGQLSSPAIQRQHRLVANAGRSFEGVGPAVSWNASNYLTGNSIDDGLSADWGVNAAVLFGRQKVNAHLEPSEKAYATRFFPTKYNHKPISHYDSPIALAHHKAVVVPNVGGFAGVSFHLPNAKVSFGYRADFFFGAMDGGVETRKSEDIGFYGPFASISVGLGG